ncbi:MAG: hypothetical protein JSW61_04230 [Candidatus Thorarchaeota archaeon]|nr:MAG: hypothetical protein JSW61_04230 [Candidatus Thorarchaeota archaeon]
MSDSGALAWILDVEAYDFDIGVLAGTDITGKALVISRQLWSVIRGDKVVSILIGPGVFKGVAESGPRRIEVMEHLSALIFDPAMLRYDEPVPQVDIVNPEVIDPLSTSKPEEIYAVIRKLIVEKGNVLAVDPLVKVSSDANVPETAHYAESLEKISVSHVSGVQRARFILAGTNSPLYRPFADWYVKDKYRNPEQTKIMDTFSSKFAAFEDNETLSDWTIVEKYGITEATGIAALQEEYQASFNILSQNEAAFLFD